MPTDLKLMSKILARTFVFACGLLVLYLVVLAGMSTFIADPHARYLVRRYTNLPLGAARYGDSSMLRFREIQHAGTVDVLFVGSSHCYRSFDPRLFRARGLSAFNMGSTAQCPLTSYYLLREYLGEVRPRAVVLEVYWGVMRNDGVESVLDLTSNLPLSWNLVAMTLATKDILAVNGLLTTCLDFRRQPLSRVAPNLLPGDTYVGRGFVETARVGFTPPETGMPPYTIEIDPRQVRYLGAIVRGLRQRGVPLVLVSTPVSAEYLASIKNYETWTGTMTEFSRTHGVRYIDFNQEGRLSAERYFFDKDHLNERGVQAVNAALYEELASLPEFASLTSR